MAFVMDTQENPTERLRGEDAGGRDAVCSSPPKTYNNSCPPPDGGTSFGRASAFSLDGRSTQVAPAFI